MSEHSVAIRFANGREVAIEARRRAAGVELFLGARVGVCLRAEALRLTADQGLFPGMVTDVEYGGASMACSVLTDVGELRVDVPSSVERPRKGELVHLSAAPTAIHLVGPA